MRRTVARYGACLQQLPSRQRRVLRMRAGVGPRDPASRATVARRLDLTVARVRRVEHRALRTLRRAGRDGCAATMDTGAGAPMEGSGAATVLASEGGAGSTDGPAAGGDDGGSAGGSGGGASGGTDAGNGGSGGVKGIAATRSAPGAGGSGVVLPLLGVLLVLACLVGFGLEARRVWRSDMGSGA